MRSPDGTRLVSAGKRSSMRRASPRSCGRRRGDDRCVMRRRGYFKALAPQLGESVRTRPGPGGRAGHRAGVPAAAGRPLVVFLLGDSLTAGFRRRRRRRLPGSAWWRHWPPRRPIGAVNAGVSGDSSAGGVRRIDWVLRQQPGRRRWRWERTTVPGARAEPDGGEPAEILNRAKGRRRRDLCCWASNCRRISGPSTCASSLSSEASRGRPHPSWSLFFLEGVGGRAAESGRRDPPGPPRGARKRDRAKRPPKGWSGCSTPVAREKARGIPVQVVGVRYIHPVIFWGEHAESALGPLGSCPGRIRGILRAPRLRSNRSICGGGRQQIAPRGQPARRPVLSADFFLAEWNDIAVPSR